MKKSNVIIFALLAACSAFLLWLWYFLGFNRVDDPLDLVVSIVWWAVIVVAIAVIVKMERTRRQRIRTVYVGERAAFNSEKGLVPLDDAQSKPMDEVIASILQTLQYDFSREDFPDKDEFEVKYFVRTKAFDVEEPSDDEAADRAARTEQDEAAPQPAEQKTWKGEVFVVETKEEHPFETPEELAGILATLQQAA